MTIEIGALLTLVAILVTLFAAVLRSGRFFGKMESEVGDVRDDVRDIRKDVKEFRKENKAEHDVLHKRITEVAKEVKDVARSV